MVHILKCFKVALEADDLMMYNHQGWVINFNFNDFIFLKTFLILSSFPSYAAKWPRVWSCLSNLIFFSLMKKKSHFFLLQTNGAMHRSMSPTSGHENVEIVITGRTRSRQDLCPDVPQSKYEHAVWEENYFWTFRKRRPWLKMDSYDWCYKNANFLKKLNISVFLSFSP